MYTQMQTSYVCIHHVYYNLCLATKTTFDTKHLRENQFPVLDSFKSTEGVKGPVLIKVFLRNKQIGDVYI